MKSNPAATYSSRIRNEVASSAVQPKTFPPRHSGAVCMADWPSLRFSTGRLLAVDLNVFFDAAIADGDHDADAQRDRQPNQRPSRADACQDSQLPQRRHQAGQEDDESNEVQAGPFHDFAFAVIGDEVEPGVAILAEPMPPALRA